MCVSACMRACECVRACAHARALYGYVYACFSAWASARIHIMNAYM